MRFSIIIPVYNTEKYLPKCLDSILAQSFHDFEVICINDGSIDRSQDILELYARKDGRLIVKSISNVGVSAARNIAIGMASGEYVMFVDSDDWIECDALAKLDETLGASSYDIVAYGFTHYFMEDDRFFKNPSPTDISYETGWEYYCKCANGAWFGTTWGRIYSRELIIRNNLSFNVKLSHFEDMMFTINACYVSGKVRVIMDSLYYYRRFRQGSLMSTDMRKRHMDMVQFANDLSYRFISNNDIDKVTLYKTISSYYRNSLIWSPKKLRKELAQNIDWKMFYNTSKVSIRTLLVYYLVRYIPVVACPVLYKLSKATVDVK